jgi:hypothetical protein
VIVLALIAPGLAACATQQGMTVDNSAIVNVVPKYRNAVAVRSVTGGRMMNAMTVMGVENEPLKAALESSLAASGYLARSGTPKFYVDAEIMNLDEPLIGLDMDVTADVTYKVTGAAATYPIKSKARATFSDSPLGADRERARDAREYQAVSSGAALEFAMTPGWAADGRPPYSTIPTGLAGPASGLSSITIMHSAAQASSAAAAANT